MTVDRYTKIVLTIIALALTALVVQPYTLPRAAAARDELVKVEGNGPNWADLWGPIKVECVSGCGKR
jgi:hypothetical protein